MPAFTNRERFVALVALSAPVAWQAFVVALALWKAPVFAQLFAGLGGELPLVTRAFFASLPVLWLVPLAFLGLSIDVLRRPSAPFPYFITVLVGSTLVALSLPAWIVGAMYAPMYEILRKIG